MLKYLIVDDDDYNDTHTNAVINAQQTPIMMDPQKMSKKCALIVPNVNHVNGSCTKFKNVLTQ